MGKEKIRKQLSIFLARVQKYHPQKVLLCGSYAQKKATKYSDIDIVVISDTFKSINEKKRYDELYSLTNDLFPDFQVHGVTPSEIVKMSSLTSLHHAISTGIEL